MIPVATSIAQEGSLPGEEIEFSIGDPRWVMRTQADLYSNRELAVAREYSTNAFDANRERALIEGTDVRPIEVTLPSMMNPYFKVRDHGFGMSYEVMTEVYTKFGVSTKRDSNEFNGMLGFGSKAAVAYTASFTVTSIHNGIKNVAVITRKPDWSIVMTMVAQSRTTEPSGTEVVVPVHNHTEFTAKANDFYKFWMPGTVLVNGATPAHAVGDKITDGFYHSTGWDQSYVVMGNVPYRIANPSALFRSNNMKPVNFVAYADNGDVEFTPSREDLKYTDQTKTALQKIVDDFQDKIVAKAKADIGMATSHAEAFEKWSHWTNSLGRGMFADLEYNGDKFRSDFDIKALRYDITYSRGAAYRINSWNVVAMPRTMVVTDYSLVMTSKHKRMAKDYVAQRGWKISYILFSSGTAADVKSPWVNKTQFVSWDDLKAALPKTPKAPRGANNNPNTGRIPGSFDYFTPTRREFEKSIPANQKNLFYISVQEEKRYSVKALFGLLGMKDAMVVILSQNRINKFNRDYPQVKNFITYAKSKVVQDGSTLLSDDAKELMRLDHASRVWLNGLDASKVDDPELKRLKGLLVSESSLLDNYQDNIRLANSLSVRYTSLEYTPTKDKTITSRYPLLNQLSRYSLCPHTYLYLNAAFAAESENSNE